MKRPKPGQYTYINGVTYRAKKRIFECDECALNSPFMCPNLSFANCNNNSQIDCIEWGVIFVKP